MRTARRNNGFTLFEVIIAALIIAGGVLVVAGVMSASARQARAGGAATQAPLIAQSILETHKSTQASAGTLTCGPTTFTREHNSITYTINQVITPQVLNETTRTLEDVVCPTSNPDAFSIVLDMTWTVEGVEQSASYSELISTTNLAEPRIDDFTATSVNFNALGYIEHPTDPTRNEVTLTWDVPVGGQPLDISITSDPPGVVTVTDLPAEGSHTFNATQSAMITLTAENPAGTQTRTIPVTAVNSITSFTVESSDPHHPSITGPLSDMTLEWALRAELHPALEVLTLTRDFPAEGYGSSTTITSTPNPTVRHEQVSGSLTTNREITYTLRYSLRTGSDLSGLQHIETRTVSLDYLSAPVITAFSVSPNAICPPLTPQNLSLMHTVQGGVPGAGRLVITAPGYSQVLNATTGTTTHSIPVGTTTTNYTLTATNNAGRTSTASSTLTVHAPPVITSFTSSNMNPTVGVPYTLSWNITNSASRTLNSTNVAAAGNQVFTDTTPGPRTYTLRAVSAQGCAVERDITINVDPLTITGFTIAAPVTGSTATTGDVLNYTWTTNRPINPAYHRVELLRNGSDPVNVTNAPNGTVTLTGNGDQNYQLLITSNAGGAHVFASSPTRTITAVAPPTTLSVTHSGLTPSRQATVGDSIRFIFSASGTFDTSLHTLQRQFPGGSWTSIPSGSADIYTSTRTTPGSEVINYRIVSRNGNRSLRTDSLNVTYVPVPTLGTVQWDRATATTGDQLTINAATSSLHPDLHQLQRRLNPNGSWSDVSAVTTATLTATSQSNYQYRIINKLAAPAPSAGRQYANQASTTVTVYPAPTLNVCTTLPGVVISGEPVTINAVNTGFRSELHTLEWRRVSPSATTPIAFTGNSVTTTTPAGNGPVTFEVRLNNRHTGTFTGITRTCTVTNIAAPGNPTVTLSGTYGTTATLGDTVRLTIGTPTNYDSAGHQIQYMLPSGTWTNTSPGAAINYIGNSVGNHTIQLRVISRNTGNTLTTGDTTLTFVQTPSITAVTLNRTSGTAGDALTLTATLSNFNSNLHTLQRRQGTGAWSNVNTVTTINPTSTADSIYEYRIINALAAPAPSSGKQYSNRSNASATIYAAPTLNNCTFSPTSAYSNQAVTINAVNTGFRSELHTLQWRRTNHSATAWTNFTGNTINVTTPNVTAGGTATYEVRVANRHTGTFTNITRTCSITINANPALTSITLSGSGNRYSGDTATLSWSATNFNSSLHRYEWRRSTPSATAWTSRGSNTSVSVTLPSVTSNTNTQYQVRIVRISDGAVLAGPTTTTGITTRPLPTLTALSASAVRSGANFTASWTKANYVNADFHVQVRRHNGSSWSGWINAGDNNSNTFSGGNTITNNNASATYLIEARIIRTAPGTVVHTRQGTVTVRPPLPPSSLTINRGATTICRAGVTSARQTTVSWSLPTGMSVASVVANNSGSVSGSGNSRTITGPNDNSSSANITVTVRLTNADGEGQNYTTTIARQALPSFSSFTVNGSTGTITRLAGEDVTLAWSTSNAGTVRLNGTAITGTSHTYKLGTSNASISLTADGLHGCAPATSPTRTVTVHRNIEARLFGRDHANLRADLPRTSTIPAAYSSLLNTYSGDICYPYVSSSSTISITFTGPSRTGSGRAGSNSIPNFTGRWRTNYDTYTHHTNLGFSGGSTQTINVGSTWTAYSISRSLGSQFGGNANGSQIEAYNSVQFRYASNQFCVRFGAVRTGSAQFFGGNFSGFGAPPFGLGYRLGLQFNP